MQLYYHYTLVAKARRNSKHTHIRDKLVNNGICVYLCFCLGRKEHKRFFWLCKRRSREILVGAKCKEDGLLCSLHVETMWDPKMMHHLSPGLPVATRRYCYQTCLGFSEVQGPNILFVLLLN